MSGKMLVPQGLVDEELELELEYQGLVDEELELELGYQEGLVPMQVEHQEEAGMERSKHLRALLPLHLHHPLH